MLSTDTLLAFAMATLTMAFFPGPAMLYTAAQTAAHGRRAGLLAVLGIHLGGYAHVIAAALGLSVLFRHVPIAFVAVKFAGAAYLVWMGVNMFRQGRDTVAGERPQRNRRRAFVQSVIVQLLNPKVALFYLAFLPLFADPAAALHLPLQLLILGIIVNLTFAMADTTAVFLTDRILRMTRHRVGGMQLLRKAGGAILVGLGIRIAFMRP